MQAITILALIAPIRHLMAQYGVKKVYLDIKDDLVKNNIKMGEINSIISCEVTIY